MRIFLSIFFVLFAVTAAAQDVPTTDDKMDAVIVNNPALISGIEKVFGPISNQSEDFDLICTKKVVDVFYIATSCSLLNVTYVSDAGEVVKIDDGIVITSMQASIVKKTILLAIIFVLLSSSLVGTDILPGFVSYILALFAIILVIVPALFYMTPFDLDYLLVWQRGLSVVLIIMSVSLIVSIISDIIDGPEKFIALKGAIASLILLTVLIFL